MHTPVAFIIFNRPDTTERVFAEIARAKPSKLLVIADGPRDDHPEDAETCAAARSIIERIDWKCELFKDYSDINLGCGKRPATGISWVFEHVEEAIILEDDCVPHPTFFRYCEELLKRYRDDERIVQICGNNFQFGKRRSSLSYFFSWHNICWGWASWRRAWRHFDIGLKLWPMLRNSPWLLDIVGDLRAVAYWQDKFDRAYASAGNIDYWDYQWTFACWSQNGLSILPNTTLISNVGFGVEATHTKSANNKLANLPAGEMIFPLQHPPYVVRNSEADQFFVEQVVIPKQSESQNIYRWLHSKVSPFIPRPIRKAISSTLLSR
ncbi:MAG TPA: glycosyltransferase family 2 protein [Thermodesulfobacteriota bacterium]